MANSDTMIPTQVKVASTMILVIAAGLGISFGLASLWSDADRTPAVIIEDPDAIAEIPFEDATTFPSTTFTLDEGYSIQLVAGWELVAKTPDRRVDRYRFERKADPDSIFTISVYDREQIGSLDDLIVIRYGSAFLRQDADVKVGDLNAKRISAEFLDMGATIDLFVEADAKTYVSLYGIHPASEALDLEISKQINYMQKSFKATK